MAIIETLALVGVQFTWTVELASGTSYLVSLGLSKQLTALVWLAGPLSGLIVQPLVGFFSDRSTSCFGRRRPYIIGGTIIVVFAIILIAFCHSLAQLLAFENFGSNTEIGIAIFGFYLLDFSINVVQSSCRSLIVDVIPVEDQNNANAWACRMIGLGNILGYAFGFIDLVYYFPFLGSSQIKVLCMISIGVLISTISLTCIFTREIINQDPTPPNNTARRIYSPFIAIIRSLKSMPPPIQMIFNTQFLAWMGWFPFLFYSSSWISNDPRIGSFALSIFALISLTGSFLIPLLNVYLKVEYKIIWCASHLLFSALVFSTLAFDSSAYTSAVVALVGITIALWIPFALIGEFVSYYSQQQQYSNINQSDLEISDDLVNCSSQGPPISAGMVLGLHNMYICVPQFMSTLLSMIIFSIVDSDPFGWAIRAGGVAMLLAGGLAMKTSQLNHKND